jgi:hypothetical protein
LRRLSIVIGCRKLALLPGERSHQFPGVSQRF